MERVNDPPPAVDRLGRIVIGDDGAPVPDIQAQAAAAAVIIRAAERVARLRGLDAPRRAVNINMGDIDAVLTMAREEVERLGEQRADDARRVRIIEASPADVLE